MKEFFLAIRHFFSDRFTLEEDRADEQLIVADIRRDVQFRGANLWALIFAIVIASIGLNVNSTAVIIGAMLISPLMGPIMGVGLGVGTYDFDLAKRGIKNLLFAAMVSILTSAAYFYLSPLRDTNSELLARTNPSLWDVFLGFFGGMAGIIAGTRKEKSNVIPGVAIATALMPPLCTAGFGLALGDWMFFLGALYLFFINSLFICLATFLIVKRLNFHKREFPTESVERKVSRTMWMMVAFALLPSFYLTYRIVERSIFEGNAAAFVQKEFHFPQTQIVSKNFSMGKKGKSIEILLVGQELTPHIIDSLRNRMRVYHLDSTLLVVHQGLSAKKEIDLASIRASILEDVFRKENLDTASQAAQQTATQTPPNLSKELRALYPDLKSFSLAPVAFTHLDTLYIDTVYVFVGHFTRALHAQQRVTLKRWLQQRIPTDSIQVMLP